MSAEHGERKPELKGIMSGAVRTVSEQSFVLMQRVVQVLEDGGQVDVASLIAAFDLNANLSLALKEFLERRGEVVFQEGQPVQPTIADSSEKSQEEPNFPEGHKTFGELLRAKIDSELLSADKDSLTKLEIFEAAKNKGAVRKAAVTEGFKAQKNKFTREETVQILYRVFTTPGRRFKKKQDSFSLQEIKVSFSPTHRDLISQLSGEINYDWLQNPTVDYKTAMELRGLVQLEKIATGEKVAGKGRPGAFSTRSSGLPSTPSREGTVVFTGQP